MNTDASRTRNPLLKLARPVARAAVALALIAGLVTAALPSAGASSVRLPSHAGPYKIVLSNNFLGNDWRPQMERLAQLTAKLPPFAGKITLQVVNAASTVQAHNASLNDIILSKPDALLLVASSTTAQNPTIARACAAGILVITVSSPVTAPCAYNVNQDYYGGMVLVGRWMAQTLHGKGNVLVDTGLPGLSISQDIYNGFLAGLKKDGPAIKDVGEFPGNYAQGPEQQGVTNLLVAHPNTNGVMTQGYCTPVFNAMESAHKADVPATCIAYNGELTHCAMKSRQCAILTGSPVVVQICMKLALDILEGKPAPPKSKIVPVPMRLYVTSKRSVNLPSTGAIAVEQMVAGKNFFPNLPPGLALPLTLPQYHITPQQAVGK